MPLRLAPVLLIALLAALPCLGRRDRGGEDKSAPSALSLAEATVQVASKAAALAGDRPIRLAVVTFDATQKEYAEKNDFGRFFTEELTSEIKKSGDKVRLFERSRLEAITRENALTLSGLIDQKEAARIGELAPIDHILTGTYTRLADAVGINARMLDVVSGEILFTCNLQVKLSDNLAALFRIVPPAESRPGQPTEKVDPCAAVQRQFEELLIDLSTRDKVSAVVEAAVTVPFDTLCGRVHYRVLGRFERHKIWNDRYNSFLAGVLRQVPDPTADPRCQETMRYFDRHGLLSDELFGAGLEAVRKIGSTWLNVYAGYLFQPDSMDDASYKLQCSRIDAFMKLAKDGKIGLPVAVAPAYAFLELVGGLGPFYSSGDSRLIMHCYDRFRDVLGPKELKESWKVLESICKRERDPKAAATILGWACDNLNQWEPGEKSAGELFDFARHLAQMSTAKDSAEAVRSRYRRDFGTFKTACRDQLAATLGTIKYPSQRKDAAVFCLQHGISVPGLVPTADGLVARLSSQSLDTLRDAAELLSLMGSAAAPAEEKVQKLLRRSERMNGSGTTNLQWALIGILGAIRTTNPESQAMLVSLLDSRDYCVPDSAMAALARIGKPVIPLLKKELPARETYLQIRIVEVLGKMGPEAKAEVPWLKDLLSRSSNDYLKDAIEDALEKIH